jgi:hypothetical protein
MTAATLERANEALRTAVEERLATTPKGDPKMVGYSHSPTVVSCCEGQRTVAPASWDNTKSAWDGFERKLPSDWPVKPDVHPTSQAFFDLCDQLKEMHRRKSRDYGCPTGEDPLANIRNGAKFVGIPDWKGAMVRLSDKVTRLAAYNATGRLENESLEDNLFDLASYSLLALLLHREERGE